MDCSQTTERKFERLLREQKDLAMLAFSDAVKGQSIPSLEACRAEFKKHLPQCGMQELRDSLARQGFNMSGRAGLRPLAELLIENILKTGASAHQVSR